MGFTSIESRKNPFEGLVVNPKEWTKEDVEKIFTPSEELLKRLRPFLIGQWLSRHYHDTRVYYSRQPLA